MDSDQALHDCRAEAALYVVGGLSSEESQNFEQRLRSGCPFCTAESAAFAKVAAHLGTSVQPVEPPRSLRARVLNSAGAKQEQVARSSEMTLVRSNETPWVPLPIPGIDIRPLLGEQTLLVRMQPGSVYPGHEHSKNEQCMVLEGSLTDGSGMTVYAGDFVCMHAGSTHEPIHTDTGCVLLVAYTA